MASIFLGWVDLSRAFLGYSKQSEYDRDTVQLKPSLVVLRIKYNQTSLVAVQNLAWDFLGVYIWSTDFVGF